MDEYLELIDKEDHINFLNGLIKNKNALNVLNVRFNGETIEYIKDEDKVKRMAAFGETSTCYDFQIANDIVHDIMSKHIDEIAEWLMSKQITLKLTEEYDEPIGFVLNYEGERHNTNKVMVVFRKEIPGNTECGFSLSSIQPYI